MREKERMRVKEIKERRKRGDGEKRKKYDEMNGMESQQKNQNEQICENNACYSDLVTKAKSNFAR